MEVVFLAPHSDASASVLQTEKAFIILHPPHKRLFRLEKAAFH